MTYIYCVNLSTPSIIYSVKFTYLLEVTGNIDPFSVERSFSSTLLSILSLYNKYTTFFYDCIKSLRDWPRFNLIPVWYRVYKLVQIWSNIIMKFWFKLTVIEENTVGSWLMIHKIPQPKVSGTLLLPFRNGEIRSCICSFLFQNRRKTN